MVEERLSQEWMGGVWVLGGPQSGECFGLIKKTAAGPVEPVGGVCPSKEVWETLRWAYGAPGFSTPPCSYRDRDL
jgi:hypothetical protein